MVQLTSCLAWESHSTSLSLSLFICKMGLLLILTFQGSHEDEKKKGMQSPLHWRWLADVLNKGAWDSGVPGALSQLSV